MKIKLNKGEELTLIRLLQKEINATKSQIKNYESQNFTSELIKKEVIAISKLDLELLEDLKQKFEKNDSKSKI